MNVSNQRLTSQQPTLYIVCLCRAVYCLQSSSTHCSTINWPHSSQQSPVDSVLTPLSLGPHKQQLYMLQISTDQSIPNYNITLLCFYCVLQLQAYVWMQLLCCQGSGKVGCRPNSHIMRWGCQCIPSREFENIANQKFGTKPNVSPPGALSPIGGAIRGLTFLSQQSHVARTPPHQHTQNAQCRLRVGRHQPTNRQWTKIHQIFWFNAGYLCPFQRYLRSKLKVVLNRAEFLTFFAIPNFNGAVPPKFVRTLSAPLCTISRDSFIRLLHLALKLQWLIRYS